MILLNIEKRIRFDSVPQFCYLFKNDVKKEYKSNEFICPKVQIEKMKKKNQEKAKANTNIYKTEICIGKATKHERYFNTLFNGQAVLRQSSDSPQILKVCNNCHLLRRLKRFSV